MFWVWFYIVGFFVSLVPASVVFVYLDIGNYQLDLNDAIGYSLKGGLASLLWPVLWLAIGTGYLARETVKWLETGRS